VGGRHHYIATWEGFLYLAVVLDVFSRKVRTIKILQTPLDFSSGQPYTETGQLHSPVEQVLS